MTAIDYWHPVLPAGRLGQKPVGVRVAGGHELVLFRQASGEIGALEDRCPHRRMRLSLGKVTNDRLTCPYHGWNFAPNGEGRVPSTPTARVCAKAYAAIERHGAIWVKDAESKAELPKLGVDGQAQVFCLLYHIGAPLELVVDNFAEIEHSVTTHVLLAYDDVGIAKTECEVSFDEEHVLVRNVGPQKAVFRPFRWLLGYGADDLFVGEGVIRFQPVHLELTNYWLNPHTQNRRYSQMSGAVFFNPISRTETDLMLFGFTTRNSGLLARALKKAFLTGVIHVETLLDKRMMEAIADKNPDVRGMKLGRFDRPLVAIRDRISSLYWGAPRPDFGKPEHARALEQQATTGFLGEAE